MSKRLQILVEDHEFAEFHEAASRDGLTMSEWARQALRHARRMRSTGNASRKLAAIRVAAGHAFPTGDIEQMLDEIEQGYHAP
ncbi:MAG: antitoxin [Euzebya sp.]